jgi:hypothetical protein
LQYWDLQHEFPFSTFTVVKQGWLSWRVCLRGRVMDRIFFVIIFRNTNWKWSAEFKDPAPHVKFSHMSYQAETQSRKSISSCSAMTTVKTVYLYNKWMGAVKIQKSKK